MWRSEKTLTNTFIKKIFSFQLNLIKKEADSKFLEVYLFSSCSCYNRWFSLQRLQEQLTRQTLKMHFMTALKSRFVKIKS